MESIKTSSKKTIPPKPTLLSRRPVVSAIPESMLQNFIQGEELDKVGQRAAQESIIKKETDKAAKKTKLNAIEKVKPSMPWEVNPADSDAIKTYLLRLPNSYLLKLKYIREKTGKSMQHVCLDVILPAIDEEITRIG